MFSHNSKEINTGGWFDNLRQRYAQTSFGFAEIQTNIFQQTSMRSSYIQPGELVQISTTNNGELNYLMRRSHTGQETYLPLKAPREFTERIFLAADQFYTDSCLILRHQCRAKIHEETICGIHALSPDFCLNPDNDAITKQFDGIVLSDSLVDFTQCEPNKFNSLKYVKLPFHLSTPTAEAANIGYSLIYFPTKDILIATGYPLLHPHLWVMKQPFCDDAHWEFISITQIDNLCFTLTDDEFFKKPILEIILTVMETYQEINRMNIHTKLSQFSGISLFSSPDGNNKKHNDDVHCPSCCLL